MKKICFSLAFFVSFFYSMAQDSLLRTVNDSLSATQNNEYVTGTFKALYIVNMKTVEAPAEGALNVEIQHRFGSLNSGSYELFGLDNATLRLGLDYGITDRLTVGIGRSSFQKTFDGYLKYKLFRQTAGSMRMPVSVSLLTSLSYYTQHFTDQDYLNSTYRLSYTTQVLIARKFNNLLSIELTPTLIHYNLVPTVADQNNVFALAGGARMKISKRMSINVEYDYLFANQVISTPVNHSLSFGWDIETGGHVFQLVFSNSQSMIESQYIAQTPGTWGNGDIYFGFNISRIFNLKPHNKPKD
jgi:opacity protein-like surface antigen